MKIIPLLLAILLLGQSLRAGVESSCCQSTDTKTAIETCHSTGSDFDLIDVEPPTEENNCSECHCPGCFIGTTTLVETPQLTDFSLPNFSNPILYQRQIHSSDYAFSPWQPPQF